MALGVLKPVANHNGLPDTGHGIPIPSTIHSTQPCNSPPIELPIIVKDKTCLWPPTPLIPLTALNPMRATVLVNGLPIMINSDTFTTHRSITTNIINYVCPCGKAMCIIPTPINCSLLTIEDMKGVGHGRTLWATTFTVFAFKIPIGRLTDPLGFGVTGKSWPCSSAIAFGSPNVLAG
jgi:hypothetical protein|tara:strand:- start:58 stop:591 length:534 start_codon:yes stop_codon:yes gene_type:complete